MDHSFRKRIWLTLRLLVSALLLAWLILQYDWYLVWQAMLQASLWGIAALIAGVLVNRLVAYYRFWVVLRTEGAELSLGAILRLGFLSSFVTNFLPTTIGGDVVKVGWLVSRGYSAWRSAFWTLYDRLSNMAAVLLLLPFCLSLPTIETRLAEQVNVKVDVTIQLFIFITLCLVSGVIFGLGKVKPAPALTPEEPLEKGFFQRVAETWHKLLPRRGTFGLLVAISLISIIPNLLGTWLIAIDMDIKVSLAQVTGIYVVLYFVTLLPISLNGLGVQEVTTAYLYQSLGATQAQAAALAVLMRFAIWMTSLPGAIWLGRGVITTPSQIPVEQVKENG